MLLSSFFTVMLLLLDARLSESSPLNTIKVEGTVEFKPGGSEMILSLKGQPGSMPSPNQGATPTSSSGSSGSSGTSPSAGPSTLDGFKDYEQIGLKMHNKFRDVHGSQMMKLNKKMCEDAQAYAEKLAASGKLKHSQKSEREGQGENLSMGCSSAAAQTVTEGVTNWYNEVCNPGYNFDQGKGQGGTGHFTQVVWNDSVELGIGKAEINQNNMKCAYIVGRYKPLGNFNTGNDDYKKNVQKGRFDRDRYCKTVESELGFKDAISKPNEVKIM